MASDVRSPYVFDTRDVGRRAGSMREYSREFGTPEHIGTDIVAVAEGEAMTLNVRLESVLEGVLASVQVKTLARGECGRCLDPVQIEIDTQFQELFCYPDKVEADQGDEHDEELYQLDGDLLDTTGPITDAVGLALPFQPLCDTQCPGLCTDCGVRVADDPDHQHDNIDPRWSALQNLASLTGNREEK